MGKKVNRLGHYIIESLDNFRETKDTEDLCLFFHLEVQKESALTTTLHIGKNLKTIRGGGIQYGEGTIQQRKIPEFLGAISVYDQRTVTVI